jgi:hypothetical protein
MSKSKPTSKKGGPRPVSKAKAAAVKGGRKAGSAQQDYLGG